MNQYRYIDDVKIARDMGLASPYQRKVHIHTLDGKPLIGTTSLKSIVGNKDNLMQWYGDMSAIAGLMNSASAELFVNLKKDYEAAQAITDKRDRAKAKEALDKKYPDYALARRSAVNHRDEKAEEGTERHDELKNYVEACLNLSDGKPLEAHTEASDSLQRFVAWARDNVNVFYFTEVHGYHRDLWVGGIADIGLQLKDGRRLVGDHKSSKEAYEEQFLQCAIYDLLLGHSGGLDRDGNKLFDWEPADGYVVFPFRSEPFTPEFRWNTVEFRDAVVGLKRLYKLLETVY